MKTTDRRFPKFVSDLYALLAARTKRKRGPKPVTKDNDADQSFPCNNCRDDERGWSCWSWNCGNVIQATEMIAEDNVRLREELAEMKGDIENSLKLQKELEIELKKEKRMRKVAGVLMFVLLSGSLFAAEHDAGTMIDPDFLKVSITTGPTTTNPDPYHSIRLLTWEDYDRLKELQYINAIKAIIHMPDSYFVVQSTTIPRGSNKYEVIRERTIMQIINDDSMGFFDDSPAVRGRLREQFKVNASTP